MKKYTLAHKIIDLQENQMVPLKRLNLGTNREKIEQYQQLNQELESLHQNI